MTYVDPIVTWMQNHDIPLTRDRYLNLAYPEGVPEPWTAEHEALLPVEFRLATIEAEKEVVAVKANKEKPEG
jgi:hypothetical protein